MHLEQSKKPEKELIGFSDTKHQTQVLSGSLEKNKPDYMYW